MHLTALVRKHNSCAGACRLAICTLTTVGYGDVYPVTIGGKVFTSLMVLVGLGVIAVPTGMFASALSEARKAED